GGGMTDRLSLYVLGAFNAMLVPLLVIDLGLIVLLMVGRTTGRLPNDWVLGPWVSGTIADWPYYGRTDFCLLALTAAGFALSLLFAATQLLFVRAVARAAFRVASLLRGEIHRQAFRLGPDDLLGGARTQPEQLFTDQCEILTRALIAWWRVFPRSAFALLALMAVAFALNPWLALLSVLLAIAIFWIRTRLKSWSEERVQYWRDRATIHYDRLLDDLHLSPLAASYGLPDTPGGAFADNLKRYHDELLRERTSRAMVRATLMLAILVAATFLTLVIGFNVLSTPPGLTVPAAVVLGVSLICAYFPLSQILRLPRAVQDAERVANEVFTFLDRTPGVGEADQAKPLERLRQSIEFDRVTLADRDGHKLLNEASFTLPAGMRLAIIASDQRTPLALAGLLVRFYDPTSGRICFDGREISRATLDTVRGQAVLVMQRGAIFTGSVHDNIACGEVGFTTLQVTEASQQARAFDIVQNLPDGFTTVIGNHEVRLRPDESLRIALSRALLRNPSLLILEEPPAPPTEAETAELDAAIQRVADGRTLILLPHRLATLRSADKIVLLHEGHVHAMGTHAELIQSSDLYRHINYVRFNPFRHVSVS
ncbi:MAG: ABC transporter ATP-binding protein, partial [Planctomycetales bacterium]|nr:ABC transporter ATP-binding protein [Planctomycetales bacterium]